MNGIEESVALEYTRRLHKDVNDWYTSADNKAQILLTLNSVLLGFVGGAAFWGSDKLHHALDKVGYETFGFFIAFLISLGLSITSALMCLKSRLRHEKPQELLPTPNNIWFFQMLPSINPKNFGDKLRNMTPELEIEALSSQIQILSFNIITKHVWVNRGFKFFVVGLLCFLMVVASYIVRLYMGISDKFSLSLAFVYISIVLSIAFFYKWNDDRDNQKAKEFQQKFS